MRTDLPCARTILRPRDIFALLKRWTHIKKLDACFGQCVVRTICDCGACRGGGGCGAEAARGAEESALPKTAVRGRFAVSASPSAYGRPPYETYLVGFAGLT